MYGWRARLGVLVPSVIMAIEPEFRLMTPEGVSCHHTRVSFQGGGLENLRNIEKGLADATRLLLDVRPTVMALSGTGASFAGGHGYDQMLIKKMKEINGNIPTTTTSTAVIEAFKEMGIKKVSVAMPYIEEVARAGIKFIEESGIKVQEMKWLGLVRSQIAEAPKETVYHLAKAVDRPESDAVFISCINFHAIEVIESLETDLKKPVITSNQATMWNLLRLAGINDKIDGYGQLLSRH